MKMTPEAFSALPPPEKRSALDRATRPALLTVTSWGEKLWSVHGLPGGVRGHFLRQRDGRYVGSLDFGFGPARPRPAGCRRLAVELVATTHAEALREMRETTRALLTLRASGPVPVQTLRAEVPA